MKTLNNSAESFSYISPDFQVIEIQSEGVCLSASQRDTTHEQWDPMPIW